MHVSIWGVSALHVNAFELFIHIRIRLHAHVMVMVCVYVSVGESLFVEFNLNWNKTLENNALLQLESINLHKWFSFSSIFSLSLSLARFATWHSNNFNTNDERWNWKVDEKCVFRCVYFSPFTSYSNSKAHTLKAFRSEQTKSIRERDTEREIAIELIIENKWHHLAVSTKRINIECHINVGAVCVCVSMRIYCWNVKNNNAF